MESERKKRVVELIGTILIGTVLILVPGFVRIHGASLGPIALRILVGLVPIMFVPLLASKLAPSSDFIPISMRRWTLVLGLIFLAQLAVESSDVLFPSMGFVAHASFALMIIIVPIGVWLILRKRRVTP